MPGLLIRLAIAAFGLAVATAIVPGMVIDSTGTLILAALLLGIVNAIVRPIAVILTLPLTIVSLGIFLLVVNAAMLGLVAALLDGLTLTGFPAAFAGSVLVSITGWLASWFIGPKGRVEVVVVQRGKRYR